MDTNVFLFALLFVGFVRFVVVNILYTKKLLNTNCSNGHEWILFFLNTNRSNGHECFFVCAAIRWIREIRGR